MHTQDAKTKLFLCGKVFTVGLNYQNEYNKKEVGEEEKIHIPDAKFFIFKITGQVLQ